VTASFKIGFKASFYRPGDRTTFGGPVPVELMRFTVE
jgi:hypothetical protein